MFTSSRPPPIDQRAGLRPDRARYHYGEGGELPNPARSHLGVRRWQRGRAEQDEPLPHHRLHRAQRWRFQRHRRGRARWHGQWRDRLRHFPISGSSGVALSGGVIPTLTAAGNFVDNCYIHHVGVFYKQGVGVAMSGVGQRVSHCLIHDTPRFAIQFTGNNHILEYNHLRHLALETEDVGATYCGGRDWISPRGTVIRYNFIHDVLGFGWNGKWTSPYFAWGIYLDDNSGGVDVIGNIVARCGRSCIHGHSARDSRVENNIFVEGGMRQWEFNGWTVKQHFWEKTLPQMEKGYESVAHLPAWKDMRGMETMPPAQIPDSEGWVMSGDVFTHNIIA
ncbi:MAG: right-handed parallel beta-helix repeat-containing protein [Pirellulales bacterium]